MSFFGPPPEHPVGMPTEPPKWGPPLWDRAAEDTLGISVGISVVLAVTDEHAVIFDNVHAYPNGFAFDLVQIRNPNIPVDFTQMHQRHMFMNGPRLGLEFVDGSMATTEQPGFRRDLASWALANGRRWLSLPNRSQPRGKGSTPRVYRPGTCFARTAVVGPEHRQTNEFWCFRLPPPGSMTIDADWPDHFDEVAIDVDVTPILDAASRSRVLWART